MKILRTKRMRHNNTTYLVFHPENYPTGWWMDYHQLEAAIRYLYGGTCGDIEKKINSMLAAM